MTTDAEITAALSNDVSLHFRFERQTAAGVYLADVSPAFSVDAQQSIELDNTRAILRTASFTIDPTQASIDAINDCIAVKMEALIGGAWESFPMGLFRLVAPDEEFRPNGRRKWSVSAADLTSVLIDNSPSSPVTVASGTNYMLAVGAILTSLGLRSDLPSVSYTTPVAFTWPQGGSTTWLTVVNDLLWGINHYPIAPDATGVFKTRARVDPATWTEGIHYQSGQMVVEPFNRRRDRTKYANRVTVKIEDPSRAPAAATRNNNDSNSSISQVNTGNNIALMELAGGRVYDTTVAADIAAYELRALAGKETGATLQTVLDPRRESRENYRLTVDAIETSSLWIVQGWQVDLKPGAIQTHRLHKALSILVSA